MKSFDDYTENEKLTLICKAIEEMRTEKTKLLGQQTDSEYYDCEGFSNIRKVRGKLALDT